MGAGPFRPRREGRRRDGGAARRLGRRGPRNRRGSIGREPGRGAGEGKRADRREGAGRGRARACGPKTRADPPALLPDPRDRPDRPGAGRLPGPHLMLRRGLGGRPLPQPPASDRHHGRRFRIQAPEADHRLRPRRLLRRRSGRRADRAGRHRGGRRREAARDGAGRVRDGLLGRRCAEAAVQPPHGPAPALDGGG